MVIISLLLFLSLLFVFVYLYYSTNTVVVPLSDSDHYNNHKPYPFIGSLISFHHNSHRLIHWFTDLIAISPSQTVVFNQFGPKKQMIVTANPANIKHILKNNFDNYPKGKQFRDILGDFLGMGIFNVDGKLWTTQRKLASHEFSTKSLREYVIDVLEEEITKRLIPLLEKSSQNNDVLDMQDVLRRLAFDISCKISLGWDPCCLNSTRNNTGPVVSTAADAFDEAAVGLIQKVDSASASAMRGIALASWVWKMKRLLNVGSERKLKEALRIVHQIVNEIIRDRKSQMKGHVNDRDLLSRFISAGHDDELVRDMVISFLMAGRDSTSAGMTWLFWLLSWHPAIEEKVLKDVSCVIKDENNPLLNSDDLKQMVYLKACLCESMRLYPPVMWDSKQAEDDDLLPDGTPVYKGNRVVYFPFGMGRMEALWGKDCLEFRPDRWFSESGDFKMESPYKFTAFQAGPRVCLGRDMAFTQMKYVMASVIKRFELFPVCSDQPVVVPLLTAHMDGGFKVRVRRRRDVC